MPVDINPVPRGGANLNSPADPGRGVTLPKKRRIDVVLDDVEDIKDMEEPEEQKSEWQTALYQMVTNAILYVDGELSEERAKAESYYKGDPLGNEREGRSKVVMTELRDAVLMILPSLMRVFFNPNPALEYQPAQIGAVDKAKQMTQFIMDVVLQQDNQGFLVFHDWFKDALVKRFGVVKVWQDDGKETRSFSASYQSLDAVVALSSADGTEVTAVSRSKGAPADVYDVEYTKTKTWNCTRVACIPPEEYLFTKGARTTGNHPYAPGVASFVGHRTRLTHSQLLGMGISQEDIDLYGTDDASLKQNVEEIARQDNKVTPTDDETPLEETRTALYVEGYPYLDVNGDGIAELCLVRMLGPSFTILGDPEPCARRPFAVLTPDPTPHHVIGSGINDYTMDLQMVSSMLWRGMLDSLVLALQPQRVYVDGEVSLADLLNTKLGAPIRARSLNAVQELTHTFVGQNVLPVLEAMETVKENRVGVTRASAGLDPAALQSSSQMAVSAAVSNAQQHIEMIARVFAETGVRALMEMLLELQVENPNGPRITKMAGKYVEIDPSGWDAGLDVRVNIAIGAGTQQEKIQGAEMILTRMDGIFEKWGAQNPIVTAKQYRDAIVDELKLMGRMDAEMYFQDVPADWAPPPPPPGAGDPNMIIAQAEASKAAAVVAEKKNQSQIDVEAHQNRMQKETVDQELKRMDLEMTDARERERIEGELVIAVMEMNLKYKTELTVAQLREQMAALRPQQSKREVTMTHADGHQVSVKEQA
jgi:hypothetical protein